MAALSPEVYRRLKLSGKSWTLFFYSEEQNLDVFGKSTVGLNIQVATALCIYDVQTIIIRWLPFEGRAFFEPANVECGYTGLGKANQMDVLVHRIAHELYHAAFHIESSDWRSCVHEETAADLYGIARVAEFDSEPKIALSASTRRRLSGPIAQSERASVLQTEGPGFESR